MSRLLALTLSLFTLVGLVGAVAGCASSAQPSGHRTGSPGPTVSGNPAPPQQVRVNESNDGRTVTLNQGDVLVLQLHNTYWKIATPTGDALSAIGKPSYGNKPVDARDCVPGAGCGMVQAKFRADHSGTAQVRASRTTCGEALMCSAHSGSYRLTVVVK